MKKFALSIAVAVGLFSFGAGTAKAVVVNTNFMLVQITGTIVSPLTNSPVSSTNLQGTVTSIYKSTTNVIGNADILNMLETEYATPFPAGAKLVYQLTGPSASRFKVVDANFNILLDVSANLSISNSVVQGVPSSPLVIIGKAIENEITTNGTIVVSEVQGDEGIFYQDSHGNQFHIAGLEMVKANVLITPTKFTYVSASITISGSGSGTAFIVKKGTQVTGVITKGTAIISGKNIRQ